MCCVAIGHVTRKWATRKEEGQANTTDTEDRWVPSGVQEGQNTRRRVRDS